jgi:hypothetical protein
MKIIDRILAALFGLVMIAPTSLLVNILCMVAFLFIILRRKFTAVKAREKEVR